MTLPDEYVCITLDVEKNEKPGSAEENRVNKIVHV